MPRFNPGDIVKNPMLHQDLRFRVITCRGELTDVIVVEETFRDVHGQKYPDIPNRLDTFLTERLVIDFGAMVIKAIKEHDGKI